MTKDGGRKTKDEGSGFRPSSLVFRHGVDLVIKKHLLVLTAYTLIALVMSYPLVLNLTTAIAGVEGDAPSFVWALGWMKTALELGVNPFRTDYVFYPLGGATQVMWAVSLIALLAIPLQALFGLIATYNLLYLAATVLTAWGMFILAEDVLQWKVFSVQCSVRGSQQSADSGQRSVSLSTASCHLPHAFAPFVAGLVFAFAPLRFGYGLAFFNLFNTQLIPFYVLFLLRALRRCSRREAVIAGVLLGLNAYIDFQIAAFLVLFTVLYGIWRAIELGRARLVAAGTITLVIAIVSLIVVAPMLAILTDDFAREGGNYIRVFPLRYSAERSYDVLAFFVPNAYSTLYADAPLKIAGVNAPMRPDDTSALSPDRQAFVGYVVLTLATYATVRAWRRARVWFFITIVFALFALGPSLRVLGQDTAIPLPYLVLHQIPIINHIRIPMRYGIVVIFALAILAAIAMHHLYVSRLTHRATRLTLALVPVLILLEYATLPYPIQRIEIPRVYEAIAHVPGDFTILEIPTFNWRHAARTEMYQAIHHKRILRAYTNRIAPGLAEYFGTRGIPIVVRSLRALEGAQKEPLTEEEIAEDKLARDAVAQFYDLRYAILHRDLLPAEHIRALDAYLREVLQARVIFDEENTLAYEIPRATVPDRVHIDLRELLGQMYVGRGWQFEYPPANWQGEFNFVWARGAYSEIYFVADTARERALTLHARAESPQRVVVWLNDARIGEVMLTETWQEHRVVLPASVVRVGMNRVRLEYGASLIETIGVTTITIE